MAAAHYASEEAAVLVRYVMALIDYTKLCQPLRVAKQKVEKLKQDITDAEQKQLEKENEVCSIFSFCLLIIKNRNEISII